MPDNHFENKAKHKLDELKFNPSEAVWVNVQTQIKKDRKRRRLLVWLPLCCLLLGAGAWYGLSGKPSSQPVNTPTQLSGKGKNKANDVRDGNKQAELQKNNSILPDSSGTTAIEEDPGEIAGYKERTRADQLETSRQEMKKQVVNRPSEKDQKEEINLSHNSISSEINPNPTGTGHAGDGTNHNIGADRSSLIAASPADNPDKSEKLSAGAEKINSVEPGQPDSTILINPLMSSSTTKDSAKINVAKITVTPKKNKIQWGIAGGAGLSSHAAKFTSNFPVYAASSAGNPAYYTLPSDKQSFSWHLGVRLQKALNNTTQLFTGFQYSYSGVKIARGDLVNQPAALYAGSPNLINLNSYYPVSASGKYNYTNQYHFIEIPLGMEKQLGRKSRFSVNAGISFAWLVSTNALQFDPQTHIYFKENGFFKKTQWSLLGGFQYRLLQKRSYSLKIGPQIEYGLSGLLNRKSPYTEHQFFGGIGLLFTRNKN
ncbi:MAG TPA: hypothetical protein VFC34_01325 [Puia sp.]|nr:hypothetical protein [Puia sp.]